MEKSINIDLFKKNPQKFFSKLPQGAEDEIINLLEYILYKYNLYDTDIENDDPASKFRLFEENPIKVNSIIKYDRGELHER